MSADHLLEEAKELARQGTELASTAKSLQESAEQLAINLSTGAGVEMSPFLMGLTVFVLACFVGYYVVWKVTPALHSPLMAVTNAISSVIIVGALIACGLPEYGYSKIFGFVGVLLASINIFGGFTITQRMLKMFKKKGEA
ncbi:MAG: NAD(P) transhydrogenase subunit alpha [Alphaproteobacteria bacterium]